MVCPNSNPGSSKTTQRQPSFGGGVFRKSADLLRLPRRAEHSKSRGVHSPCGFDSHLRHHQIKHLPSTPQTARRLPVPKPPHFEGFVGVRITCPSVTPGHHLPQDPPAIFPPIVHTQDQVF